MSRTGKLASCPHCGGRHKSASAVVACARKVKGAKWVKKGNTYMRSM